MDTNFVNNLLNTNITLMDLLSWIIFGLAVGIIAVFLDPTPSIRGLISTTILGLLGALIGGLLSSFLLGVNNVTGFDMTSFIISIAGALLLLLIRRLFIPDDRHIKTTIEHK